MRRGAAAKQPPGSSARALCALVCGWALLLASGGAVEAETRVALVVGNGDYKNVSALPNPPNDARDVAQALSALGFQVKLLVDADRATFEKEAVEFGRRASAADVSLFYYGGHGLQVAGRNYLAPVDASLRRVEDIDTQTIHFDKVLDWQSGGRGVHLIFLDACRDDPTRNAKTPFGAKGLARVGAKAGLYIAYATQPDNVALDGAGRNSPFADALLHHIAEPGLDVYNMMIQVRNDVLKATGDEQIPWDSSSLTQEFFFKGDATAKAAPETRLWQVAAAQKDRSLASIYLEFFPKGPHARDLQEMLPKFPDSRDASAADVKHDEDYWDLALSFRARSLADVYLQRYPKGTHLEDAKSLLTNLEAAEIAASEAPGVCERLATHPSDATPSVAGVDFATLAAHAPQAVEACDLASHAHPDNAHYLALLARATFAAGRETEAVEIYRKAADAGDTRAMVSLATLLENGDHVAKDVKAAFALYEKAVARDNPDAAINLGFAVAQGLGTPKNMPRALALFRKAAELGSARATFNLATLVSQGVGGGKPAEALDLYRKAADLGYPGAHRAAALLLDVGRIVPRNTNVAADELLECVRADFGDCTSELTGRTQVWTPDTLRALQTRLKTAGYYEGAVDGRSGPSLAPALQQWRVLGPPKKA